MALVPKIHGRCDRNAPPCRAPSENPNGAVADMAENTRFLRMPGLYTRPRMLMLPETNTPMARPCMARMMKNSTCRDGCSENAPTIFHTISHRKAPTMRFFGGIRSVNDPDTTTDNPLATLNAPTSHGSSVFLIPSAARNSCWSTRISPSRNEKNMSPAEHTVIRMISDVKLRSSGGTPWVVVVGDPASSLWSPGVVSVSVTVGSGTCDGFRRRCSSS